MMKGSSDEKFLAYLAQVTKNLKRISKHDFQRFECLKVAVADESMCRPVLEKDIVHIMDRINKMIVFVFASALQKIFPDGTVEKMNETFDLLSYCQAMPEPDRRHLLHEAHFLPRYPEFDYTKAKDPHCAKSYVEHYGIHGPVGHTNGGTITMTAGHRMDRHMRNEVSRVMYPDLQEGGFQDSTEAVNFLKQIYPDYFEEHAHICRLMDQHLMFHAGANVETFPLHALISNVATQDHIDDSDTAYGGAGVVNFGEFEVKAIQSSGRIDANIRIRGRPCSVAARSESLLRFWFCSHASWS
jgi:hypothetical protein